MHFLISLRLKVSVASLTLAVLACAASAAPVDSSQAFLSAASKHKSWVSMVYMVRSPQMISMPQSKRWLFSTAGSSSASLVENSLTTVVSQRSGTSVQLIPTSASTAFTASISPDVFLYQAQGLPAQAYDVSVLPKDRILLQFKNSAYRVLLVPTNPEDQALNQHVNTNLTISSAPYGAMREIVSGDFHLPAGVTDVDSSLLPATVYLHHDLTSLTPVYVDPDVPSQYLPSLQHALQSWNQIAPRPIFDIRLQQQKLSFEDCLSLQVLCINWVGAPKFSWMDGGGVTSPAFDPLTGIILGGIVTIGNSTDESQLRAPSTEEISWIQDNKMTKKIAARLTLNSAAYRKVERPLPELFVEAVAAHEIGHSLGLQHDYRGYLNGTVDAPSLTTMGYAPRPILHNMRHLGAMDLDKISVIYRNSAPRNDYIPCSDGASFLFRDAQGLLSVRDPYCSPWVVGNPIEWAQLLKSVSNDLILTELPPSVGTAPNEKVSIASTLGLFLRYLPGDAEDRSTAEKTVCSSKDRDQALSYLQTNLGVSNLCTR